MCAVEVNELAIADRGNRRQSKGVAGAGGLCVCEARALGLWCGERCHGRLILIWRPGLWGLDRCGLLLGGVLVLALGLAAHAKIRERRLPERVGLLLLLGAPVVRW